MVCLHNATAGFTFKWSRRSTLSDLPLTADSCLLVGPFPVEVETQTQLWRGFRFKPEPETACPGKAGM